MTGCIQASSSLHAESESLRSHCSALSVEARGHAGVEADEKNSARSWQWVWSRLIGRGLGVETEPGFMDRTGAGCCWSFCWTESEGWGMWSHRFGINLGAAPRRGQDEYFNLTEEGNPDGGGRAEPNRCPRRDEQSWYNHVFIKTCQQTLRHHVCRDDLLYPVRSF